MCLGVDIYPIWGLLNFLDFNIDIFHQIWEVFGYCFFFNFLSSSLSLYDSKSTYIRLLDIIPDVAGYLFYSLLEMFFYFLTLLHFD